MKLLINTAMRSLPIPKSEEGFYTEVLNEYSVRHEWRKSLMSALMSDLMPSPASCLEICVQKCSLVEEDMNDLFSNVFDQFIYTMSHSDISSEFTIVIE